MSSDPSTSKPLPKSPPLQPPASGEPLAGLVEQLTSEFVELFEKDPSAYDGAFARMVSWGSFPEGVDTNDPRVVAIFDKVNARGVEQLSPHCIETKLHILAQEASKTYPDSGLHGFSSRFREDERDFFCEFFFVGPKKFEIGLKFEDLAKKDGKTVGEKLIAFIDQAVVDAMKMGC